MDKQQEPYQTIRIWVKTQRRLKILSALLGKSMIEVIDELVETRLKEVENKRGKGDV